MQLFKAFIIPRRVSVVDSTLLLRSAFALFFSLPFLCGCANQRFLAHREILGTLQASGRYGDIARELDRQGTLADYGEKNRLLWWLERGAVAEALDDDEKTIDALNKAEDYIEIERGQTSGDVLSTWFINDTASPYYGEPFEDMYVNVFKMLAHLKAGRIRPEGPAETLGGATIEARRLVSKADHLRDLYVRQIESAQKDPEYVTARNALGNRFEVADEGRFIESPLGMYLAAATFLKSGDPDLHDVASRRLISVLEIQRTLQPSVDIEKFQPLERLRPSDVNVMFVALSGTGPRKEPERFGPIPIYTYTIYFEIPKIVPSQSRARKVRVVVEKEHPSSAGSETIAVWPLDLIEDLGVVAEENFERQKPDIMTRAILRSSAKATAVVVGTEAARKATSKKESAQAAVEIIGIVGGLLFVTQTEQADLRCWTLLPGQAHVALGRLEPGAYRARIEYLDNLSTPLYAGPWRPIIVKPGDRALTTLVEHWWE